MMKKVEQKPKPGPAVSDKTPAAPLVPVSAEDFAREKRRRALKWLGPALLAILLGVWLYQRSGAGVDAQKALDDGSQMLKNNRYTEAIQSFDRAVSLRKNLTDAYLLRGRAHAALAQPEPAIQDFTKAIELRPSSPDAYLERAGIYLLGRDYQHVIADCGEVISRNPKLAHAYTLRGMAFRETGNPQKALEDFNHAVELSPVLDNYFQRAATYQLLGDHKMAIADLEKVIEMFPSSPMGYLARAKSRAALGDVAGADSDRETSRVLENRAPGR